MEKITNMTDHEKLMYLHTALHSIAGQCNFLRYSNDESYLLEDRLNNINNELKQIRQTLGWENLYIKEG